MAITCFLDGYCPVPVCLGGCIVRHRDRDRHKRGHAGPYGGRERGSGRKQPKGLGLGSVCMYVWLNKG